MKNPKTPTFKLYLSVVYILLLFLTILPYALIPYIGKITPPGFWFVAALSVLSFYTLIKTELNYKVLFGL